MKWSKFCYETMSFGKRKIEKKVSLLLLLSFSLSSTNVRVHYEKSQRRKRKRKKEMVQIVLFWILGLLIRGEWKRRWAYYLFCWNYDSKLRWEFNHENPRRKKIMKCSKFCCLSFCFLSKQTESLKTFSSHRRGWLNLN